MANPILYNKSKNKLKLTYILAKTLDKKYINKILAHNILRLN